MACDVADFQHEVLERSGEVPVVVDFLADWCNPCKVLSPILDRLEEKAGGRWVLAKVDTERHPQIAAQYGIRSIPAVKMIVGGKTVAEFSGAIPEREVEEWLEKNLPSLVEKDIERGTALLKQRKTSEAIAILEDALKAEPGNPRVMMLLSEAYLPTNRARAVEMIAPLEGDSALYPVVQAVRTIAALELRGEHPEELPDGPAKAMYLQGIDAVRSNEYARAIDAFIEVIRVNRYYEDDGARKACIALFQLIGEDGEETRQRRRAFSSALY